jgi:mannose-6-phosphate isomerase-like protein (cupin superfamily)
MAESGPPEARFDVIAAALALPTEAQERLAEAALTDREAASVRVWRAHAPVPPHLHRGCDEYLYVVSGRGTAWSGGPDRELEFGPGHLLFFPRGTAHAVTRILSEPVIFLAVDAPRRAAEDVITLTGDPA